MEGLTMTLNIAICDDDTEILDTLEHMLLMYSFKNDIELSVDIYTCGNELINRYNSSNTTDYQLLLLDIEMPEIDGIKTADIIKHSKDYDVLIVFISNYPEYMMDSFSVHPFHFIKKPISYNDLEHLMKDITEHFDHSVSLITIVSGSDQEYTLRTNNIYFIKCIDSRNRRISFHLKDSILETSGILSHWKTQLENHSFFLCSRDTLVNLNHIHYINGLDIIMENGEIITISKRNRKILMDKFLNKVIALHNK